MQYRMYERNAAQHSVQPTRFARVRVMRVPLGGISPTSYVVRDKTNACLSTRHS